MWENSESLVEAKINCSLVSNKTEVKPLIEMSSGDGKISMNDICLWKIRYENIYAGSEERRKKI